MNGQFRDRFLMMFRCRGQHAERLFLVSVAVQTRRESRVRPMEITLVKSQLMQRRMTIPMMGPVKIA
jgi:hypothetical protein